MPEVVTAGVTGFLTPEGDLKAYADAIACLLDDDQKRRAMGKAAYRFVHEERSLTAASKQLETILRKHLEIPTMSDRAEWQPLRDELLRWADAGRKAKLWFRDDDAIEPTAALDQLLALSDRYSVPVALAVIPAYTGEPLAMRLANQKDLTVTVHGWTHHNYAPDETKKQELGPHRPQAIVLEELRRGFDKLKALYPTQFAPMLVPPWNRIDKALLSELAPIGYRAISVYGLAKTGPTHHSDQYPYRYHGLA